MTALLERQVAPPLFVGRVYGTCLLVLFAACSSATSPADFGDRPAESMAGDTNITSSDRGLVAFQADAATRDASSTAPQDAAPTADASLTCGSYRGETVLGMVQDLRLLELSGIATSWRNPGVLWTHNDGGAEQLYAVNTRAEVIALFELDELRMRDWEDIAVGPGPDAAQSYVYLADIGNNGRSDRRVSVFRLAEPAVSANQVYVEASLDGAEEITLEYPSGSTPDAETLLIDPVSSDLYIVTKAHDDGVSVVYRAPAPLSDGQVVALEAMTTIDFGPLPALNLATGGDVSRDGQRVVVRTIAAARVWLRHPGTALWQAFDASPCEVPLVLEPGGEAITFADDGASLLTTGEWLFPPIRRYEHGD